MSQLFEAINNTTVTTNGMPAFKSTLNANLDLFFNIGTARGSDMSEPFLKAYKENPDLALRILQWSRDIRGGAGERQRFRDLLVSACGILSDDEVIKLLYKIPEIGRYDDLHCLLGTAYETDALHVHAVGIKNGNGLASKWAPRKGIVANKLREHLGMSPKQYRKTIVGLTKVVEQQMCANKWDEIEYSHVPSVASKKYGRAFARHDTFRYEQYLESVMSGGAKMNASAIFPHDVVSGLGINSRQADAQWKSLPNYLEGTDERILVVCDVSGSMYGLPLDVSVALGLYFSERLEGVFKDCVVTFSEQPEFVKLSGGELSERVSELKKIKWGMSTNLEAVFDKLLSVAVDNSITQNQMPTKLMIISDMQFNHCIKNGNQRAMKMIENKFSKAGFEIPQVVFWNVTNTNTGNVPISMNDSGVALVSGASPAVVKCVLGGNLSPMQIMLDAVMIDRYNLV